ncbi:Serine/threonine-protein kinase tor2 like [Verticillium longisporum]|uniref:Serine/threonine-protein kinase tor2 like n=1 Tax=Verticillium longisporum TaxID=100787 RepID=A0A8I2Z5F4_VERLO|nr:Serine/threonine-protein kinase tor2 like [Verticillium longisporum]
MATQQQIALERLETITRDLRSSRVSDDVRKRAALQLRELVLVCHRDLQPDHFNNIYHAVNTRITQLIAHGSDSAERLGGVYALDSIVDIDATDQATKYARFLQNLKAILRGKDMSPMQAAAVTLGKMCRPGGSVISELVESETQFALEWLQNERVEERRYSAALVLRELARQAPTLMYNYVGLVLDLIWNSLRDSRQLIRSTSADTIAACFRIIRERDQEMKQAWMEKAYSELLRGLQNGAVEYIHASLLMLKELLEQGGMFMQDHYPEACEIVLRYKEHKDGTIRKTVVLLIPDLASYSPAEFDQSYLHKFMVYLIGMLKKDKERTDAFLAIGNIANSVKSAIAPYLDNLIIFIREGLSVQARKRGSVDAVFECISRLAVAVGQTLSKYMEALLDPIFQCDLTPKLTQALVDMAFYIPPAQDTIRNRLLDMLSMVLCGEPLMNIARPRSSWP